MIDVIEESEKMFEKGKVSICVPTYNRPNLIVELLDSILNQTYQNFEVIITDNSDNLETKKIVESKYLDPRIRYYKNDKNLGMGGNAIKAFRLVTGEFFTFTPDDDVWIDAEKLEKQIGILNRQKTINIVFSNAISIDYGGERLSDFSTLYEAPAGSLLPAGELLPGAQTQYFLNILTAVLRTEVLLPIFMESFRFESEEYLCYYIAATDQYIGFVPSQLVALREAEHYRTAIEDGNVVDWKERKDIRIRQVLGIYITLTALHPETKNKLGTALVQNALGRHILDVAKSSRSFCLFVHALAACKLHFRRFSLLGAMKIKSRSGKSFG
ncbi:glycosyltransferase family 2 protein [Candidatus Parcubacteria bacterium]|nr:MAG: glycosyltransferase family 2 protein [Candidatus Parcubacteria bacterium]